MKNLGFGMMRLPVISGPTDFDYKQLNEMVGAFLEAGYTYFDNTKKVLCAIQVVDDATEVTETAKTIFPHPTGFNIDESISRVESNGEVTRYGDSIDGTHTGDGTETDDPVQG